MPVMREDPRPLGVVYTPREVAAPMTRLALLPLVEGKRADEILALRVCDPAMGAGAFLVEVVELLAEHLVAAWHRTPSSSPPRATLEHARTLVARTCIAGVDTDAEAIAHARHVLGGRDHRAEDARDQPAGDARDRRAADARDRRADGEPDRRALDAPSLVVADALALDWRAAFPEVFARGGFDVVLANPPYIRQERLARKATLETYAVYDGVADLYVYFIELVHRLLRARGRYCLIVPTKWMTVDYGRPLRAYLAAAGSVEGLADLSTHRLFRDADAFPCILWGSRDSAAPSITATRVDGSTSVEAALFAGDAREARARWTAEPWHIDAPAERALLDRIERAHGTLGEIIGTRWSRGVVTGLNEAFVIDRATRDRMLAADPACVETIRPFVKGRDIRPYRVADSERWILLVDRGTPLDTLPAPIRAHLAQHRARLEPRPADHRGPWRGRKPGAYAWHELQDPVVPLAKSRAPRMLYQDIQTAPACSLDRTGALVPDTTVWILPSDDLVLLAILGSSFYGWYARRRFPPALNGAVRPKLAYMQRLPIPSVSLDLRSELEALVAPCLDGAAPDAPRIDALVATAYALSRSERALVSAP